VHNHPVSWDGQETALPWAVITLSLRLQY